MSPTDTGVQRTNPVSLADEEAVKKVVVDSILGLWDVVGSFGLGRLSDAIGMREVLILDAIAFFLFFLVAATRFGRYRNIDSDTVEDIAPATRSLRVL